MTDTIFQEGDKVKVPWSDRVFDVKEFKNSISVDDMHFTKCGKLLYDHEKPTVTLVERPKKKVLKKYWIATFEDGAEYPKASFLSDKATIERLYGDKDNVQFHEVEREEEV